MVKSAEARITTTTVKTQPKVVVLRLKAMLRAQLLNPSQAMTVTALKDEHIKPIIDAYNLDLRSNLNAWQCWRELYYTFYNKFQEVTTMEQASTPYIEQIYTKQPYTEIV